MKPVKPLSHLGTAKLAKQLTAAAVGFPELVQGLFCEHKAFLSSQGYLEIKLVSSTQGWPRYGRRVKQADVGLISAVYFDILEEALKGLSFRFRPQCSLLMRYA